MADKYGSDFVTISSEDGTELELEVLSTLEYNGIEYLAVTPADMGEDTPVEVYILKSVTEEGTDEPLLCTIDDEKELETAYGLIMDQLYEEDSE